MRIVKGEDLPGHTRIRVDAVVVGTGAGGGPVAKELAEGGMTVAMLEEGDHHPSSSFSADPRRALARLYRDGGQTVTLGRPPIVLPTGRGVGGTTLVNMGTCFRTPAKVRDTWTRERGIRTDDLDAYFERVERIGHVAPIREDLAGRNAQVVKRGASALGWSGGFISRNASGCVGTGVCTYGCPTGSKLHTGLTYVAQAWEHGATTYTGCRVTKVLLESRTRAYGVEALTRSHGRLTVHADLVVIAAGTLMTPGLLRASGIDHPELGRHLSIHPATAVFARMDEPVHLHRGVPQSYYVDEFADEGVMLEGVAGPPGYLALGIPGIGARHRDVMLDADRIAQFGVMVSDTSRGTVRRIRNQTVIRYDLNRHDARTFRMGITRLAELYFAAGARSVHLPIGPIKELRSEADLAKLAALDLRPGHLKLMAFHPLGTARAGGRPKQDPVDEQLRVRPTENVYVADGSVVPTALGVNPQITIMALATRLAFNLLGRPAPEEHRATALS